VPTGTPVHIICQSGGRSARATATLTAHGYDAVNVEGGTSAWIAAGNPVDRA
jgi:rhodanese-related sulfurtransferase